jgi:hypothetical protein
MALPSPNSAHRDKPTSAKCPRYRAVLNDIRLLTRETDSTGWGGLDRPSLRALLTLTDLHSHTLTFRQPAQPAALERRRMDENILPTAILAYKTKSLIGIVPFD